MRWNFPGAGERISLAKALATELTDRPILSITSDISTIPIFKEIIIRRILFAGEEEIS